jgi:hypothetical protein
MQIKRKSGKVNLVKRFLSGQDVTEDLLKRFIDPVTGFVFADAKPSWYEEIPKGAILWNEKRSYPDPEIEGISYSNPENVPMIEGNRSKSEPVNEPVINHRQQKIDSKLLELKHIKEVMQKRKQSIDNYNRMNSELSAILFQ